MSRSDGRKVGLVIPRRAKVLRGKCPVPDGATKRRWACKHDSARSPRLQGASRGAGDGTRSSPSELQRSAPEGEERAPAGCKVPGAGRRSSAPGLAPAARLRSAALRTAVREQEEARGNRSPSRMPRAPARCIRGLVGMYQWGGDGSRNSRRAKSRQTEAVV